MLAPVTAPLRQGGRTIGSFTLSIQDDEGYKRLANRLAGLDVLMYMGNKLVKSTRRLLARPGPGERRGHIAQAQLPRLHVPCRGVPVGAAADHAC